MPDIFDFFKENESKLHEAPPDRLWQQLEKRLEQNRKQRRKRPEIRFLQLAVVALVLLILILTAVVVWHFVKREAQSRVVTPAEREWGSAEEWRREGDFGI